jgi:hypothetical protein
MWGVGVSERKTLPPIPSFTVWSRMRPIPTALLVMLLLAASGARAEFSLFGSAERTPANPFASNYASPPVHGTAERRVRARRAAPMGAPRPPRDIPR